MVSRYLTFVPRTKIWVIVFSVPAFCALTLVFLQREPGKKDTKPHILFILADNLGWNDVGEYANRGSVVTMLQ